MANGAVTGEVVEGLVEATRVPSGFGGKVALVAGGMSIGFGIGYFVASRRLAAKYDMLLKDDTEAIKDYYRRKAEDMAMGNRTADPKPSTPKDMVEKKGYTPTPAQFRRPTRPPVVAQDPPGHREPRIDPVEVEEGAVPPLDPNWNYEEELKKRGKNHPYIIHYDEFRENAPGHSQTEYIYYEDDDVLADTDGTPIHMTNGIVSAGNLSFGHGSGDPDVVFVRNEKFKLDIEITKNPGNYSELVHGLSIEHSAEERRKRPPRRFDDE